MQEFHLQVVSHNIYESLLGGGVQLSLIPVNLGALSLKVPRLLSLKVLLKLYHLSLIPKSISPVIPHPSNNNYVQLSRIPKTPNRASFTEWRFVSLKEHLRLN